MRQEETKYLKHRVNLNFKKLTNKSNIDFVFEKSFDFDKLILNLQNEH